jgi:hypothetical protein
MVPVLLGFEPEESLSMLTFGPGAAFHARVDLPAGAEGSDDVAAVLVGPLVRHGVERVVLVAHAREPEPSGTHVRAVARACTRAGVEVLEMLRADGERWFPLHPGAPSAPGGVPYDVSSHPFVLEAMWRGRSVLPSRRSLADGLAPDPGAVDAVAALVPEPARDAPAERAWLGDLVVARVADGGTVPDGQLARLLVALAQPGSRDAVWGLLSREGAEGHVALWRDVVRRSPPALRTLPASLLACAAWLGGDGALAWCALDVVPSAGPGDRTVADFVRRALERADPPGGWEPPR